MLIAVIGGETCSPEEGRTACAVGREVARRGHTLICGGRGGVMREACRGAKDAGGTTIGVLPGDDRTEANEFVDIAIATGIGFARNAIIARSADALVAVGGRYGTRSEIAFAFIAGKPLAGLSTWELTFPDGEGVPIVPCTTAADALDYCERAAPKE